MNEFQYPILRSLRRVFKANFSKEDLKIHFENNLSWINDPKELDFFMSGSFDFETKRWKSGWLPIPKDLWLKSNASDNEFPILGTGD